jgi:hypothetical protein
MTFVQRAAELLSKKKRCEYHSTDLCLKKQRTKIFEEDYPLLTKYFINERDRNYIEFTDDVQIYAKII